MLLNQVKQTSPAFLSLQAKHCQQLSRSCMDLGTARALRLMAEEYSIEAARPEATEPHGSMVGVTIDGLNILEHQRNHRR
jgi:hypothetical protein